MIMKHIYSLFLTRKSTKKIIAYLLLILFIYLFKGFLGIFLLTFIFAYIFFSLWKFLKAKIDIFIWKLWKDFFYMKKIIKLNVIIIIEYILFIWIIIFLFSWLLPKITMELWKFANEIPIFKEQIVWVNEKLLEIKNDYKEIWNTLSQITANNDYQLILNIFDKLKSASFIFLKILISLVLSLVFILDRAKLSIYLSKIKESNFSFLYFEYKIILDKVVHSFWLIIKAQAMIALVNTILTVLWLYFISFVFYGTAFPFIITLWFTVFIFWFVPVLWTFLSSIPIILISYNYLWWFEASIFSLLLIIIVHIIEVYYLNPKIVSSFMEFPISLTFVILIVSEHIFWFAWLIIWVSLFYFFIWLFDDFDKVLSKHKGKILKENKGK